MMIVSPFIYIYLFIINEAQSYLKLPGTQSVNICCNSLKCPGCIVCESREHQLISNPNPNYLLLLLLLLML